MISKTEKRWQEVKPMIQEYLQSGHDYFFLNRLVSFFYPPEVFFRSHTDIEASQTPVRDINLIVRIMEDFGTDTQIIGLCASFLDHHLLRAGRQKRQKIYPLILRLIEKYQDVEKVASVPEDRSLQAKRCLLVALTNAVYVLPNDILKHDLNVYRFIITCLQDLQEPGFDQDPVILFLKEILDVKGHQFLALEQRQEIIRLLLDVNPHRLISYSQEDITSLIQAFSKIDQPS